MNIVKPAVKLINGMNYSKKLLIMGTISVSIILVLILQIVNVSLTNITFSKKELTGIEYIEPLLGLMEHLQKYRHLKNNYREEEKTLSKSPLINEEESINEAIVKVNKKDLKYGSTLKTTDTWKAIQKAWQEKGKENPSTIISDILSLIVTVADNSNLTLDPDIDTYYLMATYSTNLPSYIEEAASSNLITEAALRKKSLSQTEREELSINKVLMNDHNLPAIKKHFKKVIDYNPNAMGEISQLAQNLESTSVEVNAVLNTSILGEQFTASAEKLAQQHAQLIQISYKLSKAIGSRLASLIDIRINSLLNVLYLNLALAASFALLLIYLFVGMYKSIIDAVRQLVQGSERLAAGNLTERLKLETKDELTQVSDSFNRMRDTLAHIIAETQTVVYGASKGDLKRFINIVDVQGFAQDLTTAVNQMTRTYQEVIHEVIRVLDAISKGDLTAPTISQHEGSFGELQMFIKQMIENLQKLILDIKISSEAIGNAVREIAQGNSDLSTRTERQANLVQEISSGIEKLTISVKETADNSKEANKLAQSASEVAMQGGKIVNEVISMMQELNESANKVSEITATIDSIAFQTNILALNAAVEAARAGEQGRGFAVVATEVRQLAQRSSAAAKEIKDLTGGSFEMVMKGTKLVTEAGSTMEKIVASTEIVTEIIGNITTDSSKQSSSIEHVYQAMSEVEKVTEKNRTLVKQAASSAIALEELVQHLFDLVAIFKLGARVVDTKSPLPVYEIETSDLISQEPVRIETPVTRGKIKKGWEEL